LVPHILLF